MSRLPYEYAIKYDDIKSLYKSVQFTTPITIEDKRAKYVIRSVCDKVRCNKLTVNQFGYINISGSDGDKIVKSRYSQKLDLKKFPTVIIDTTNEWWQD